MAPFATLLLVIASPTLAASPSVQCGSDIIALVTDDKSWESASMKSGGLGWFDCLTDEGTRFTPLHELASRSGPGSSLVQFGITVRLAEKIVRGGGQVLAVDTSNRTALHVAAERGATAAAVGLCTAAYNSNMLPGLLSAVEKGDLTALSYAEAYGQLAVAKLLLQRGGGRADSMDDQESELTMYCTSPVLDAVLRGRAHDLRQAILADDRAGSVAACQIWKSRKGWTLLHYAASVSELLDPSAAVEVVKVLLEFGADSGRPDSTGALPIAYAARGDDARATAVLLSSMGQQVVDTKDGLGQTALHAAAAAGAKTCVKLLLESGALPSIADDNGHTPYDVATRAGYPEAANVIMTALLDPVGYYRTKGQFKLNASFRASLLQNARSFVDEDMEEQGSAALQIFFAVAGCALAFACAAGVCYWLCSFSSLWGANNVSKVAALPDTVSPLPEKNPPSPSLLPAAPGSCESPRTPVKTQTLKASPDSTTTSATRVASRKSAKGLRTPPPRALGDSPDESDVSSLDASSPLNSAGVKGLPRFEERAARIGMNNSQKRFVTDAPTEPIVVNARGRLSNQESTGVPSAASRSHHDAVDHAVPRPPQTTPPSEKFVPPAPPRPTWEAREVVTNRSAPKIEVPTKTFAAPGRSAAFAGSAAGNEVGTDRGAKIVVPTKTFAAPGRSAASAVSTAGNEVVTDRGPKIVVPTKTFAAPGRSAATTPSSATSEDTDTLATWSFDKCVDASSSPGSNRAAPRQRRELQGGGGGAVKRSARRDDPRGLSSERRA